VDLPWACSHAALPAVAPDADGTGWDLYLACRDERSRAQVARAGLRSSDGELRVGALQAEPALGLGELGAFDDSGVTVSCVVDHDDARYLYYSGWTLGVTVPFYFYVGLAVSRDGGATFARVSRGPVLERDDVDPFLTASPSVLVENGTWRMWYVSAAGWDMADGAPRHRYHIRYAESGDGVRWRRDGRVAVDFAEPREYAFGRPCVVREGGIYHMYFCARGDTYRLAHATSADGLTWERDDAAVALAGAPGDWEAEAAAYPSVFRDDKAGAWHMLYNGNGYGATGVGWASMTDPLA
jgi:hypothetical protein